MTPARVLILNTTFKVEGPNAVLFELVRHLDPRRFRPIAACMHAGGPVRAQYDRAGVETHDFDMRALGDARVVPAIVRFIRRHGIDLVHAQLLRAEFYGTLVARVAGVPSVLTVANTDPYRAGWRHPVKRVLSRTAVGLATRVVAASEGVREYVARHQGVPANRMVVVHNAIDPAAYASNTPPADLLQRLRQDPGNVVICAAGRLDPQKGLEHLLRALAIVTRDRPHVKAIILGEGPLRSPLEQLAADLRLGDRVTFGGFRQDLPAVFAVADIFVMSSLWEGLPMALLGAMAAGLPVVATRVAGHTDVVRDGETGWLVPAAAPDALANRLAMLIDRRDLRRRMGEASRLRIALEFNAPTMARAYERVYDACLAERRATARASAASRPAARTSAAPAPRE